MDLRQIFLMVEDLDQSRKFYEESIGLDLIESGQRSFDFDLGTCELRIEREFDEETLSEFGLRQPSHFDGELENAIHVLEVDNIDTVYERVESSAGEIISGIHDVDWNGRIFLVRDPDGYLFELTEK